MNYKRVLTVQDISCFGQCSLTVALPIISACGVETTILPSAVLSTHTCGFSGYTFRDLSDDIPAIAKHWLSSGIRFDAVYTGYLGSEKQIEYIKNDLFTLGKDSGLLKIVDPAMADNGKLYPAFDGAYVAAMRTLASSCDILLPNITEAGLLTGIEYQESYDWEYINRILDALHAINVPTVVLTGVGFKAGTTGVVVSQKGGERLHYEHRKIAQGCHGTGDVYASAFVGALMRGQSVADAAKLAADFTVTCIELTQGDSEHRYGVKFELALPSLCKSFAE